MGLRKRLSESRERGARERAKRRDERRRAERAKAGASAADRSKARMERKRARDEADKATRAPEEAPKDELEKQEDRPDEKARPKGKAKPPEPAPGKRRPKAGAKRGAALAAGAGKLGTGARSVGTEALKLGREMVAIPVQLWLAAAEIAGAIVLKAWLRVLRPTLVWVWTVSRATLRFAQDHITPAHGVIACALVAIGGLVASQWLDYHSVTVGTDAYSGSVGAVAPPPEIETDIAGHAHAWVMLPLAFLALLVLTIALTGRRRAAALLIPIGLAVVAVALIVDLPKGLDEGTAALAYEGAKANLLQGFWMQLACALVLIVCGLMLPRYLRPAPARAKAPTGPTLFQSGAAAARKLAGRRPRPKRRTRRPRPKRKVQGAT